MIMARRTLAFTISMVMVLSFALSTIGYAEEGIVYTITSQNDNFDKYQYLANDTENTNTSKQGWNLSGSSSDKVLRYTEEDKKTFLHIANNGDKTMYFAKAFKSGIREQIMVEFDARYISDAVSISLCASKKPQDYPDSFISLGFSSGTVSFNGKSISGIKAKKWYTYTITADMTTKKANLTVKAEGFEKSLKNVKIEGDKPIVAQLIVTPSNGGGTIDFTNYTMGYKDQILDSIGKVKVFPTNQKTIDETKKLIENAPNTLRRMEYLNRGLIASKVQNGVFLSWRWLATESLDVKYNLYRDDVKINNFPLNVTNFTDLGGKDTSKYAVAALVNGVEQAKEEAYPVMLTDNGLEIKMQPPEPWKADKATKPENVGKEFKYYPSDTTAADLDGDGQMELVIAWGAIGTDSSQANFTSPQIYQAYKLDGTKMWEINIGINIRCGAHHSDIMVYDFDGDGKGEFIIKTADGTKDNAGTYIGDAKKDYRNSGGWVLAGPEYLTMFDAVTGTIINTVDYPTPRGPSDTWQEVWGDTYGNRQDRFNATVAYLDGENPSVVFARGYYTRTSLAAFDVKDKKLVMRWHFDSLDKGNEDYAGRGNHSLGVLDVDFDGKDEIIYGQSSYDDDGKGLYTNKQYGIGHGDAQHSGDLIPNRPGLEIFQPQEGGSYGVTMRDARTGELIWAVPMNGADIGRGISADVDPRYPGAESWGAGGYIAADGSVNKMESLVSSFLIWWDGDLGRELQNSNSVYKPNIKKDKVESVFAAKGYVSINGTKSTPMLTADLLGDWREEMVYPTKEGDKIKIFSTTVPTEYRMYTLLQDPAYRLAVSWQNVGYNQPTYTGFYLGFDTKEVPIPKIYMMKDGKKITNPDLEKMKTYPIEKLRDGSSLALLIGDEKALLNGNIIRIDSTIEGVAPIIDNGRTVVPVRFVSNAFGAKVDWDDAAKLITVTKGDKVIKMTLDKPDYTVGEDKKVLDVSAKSINGRTVIPLRAMAEALDKEIFWDAKGLIYISDAKQQLDAAAVDTLIESIKNAALPELKVGVEILSGKALLADQIPIINVTASGNDGNIESNAIDGDFGTRWSSSDTPSILEVQLIGEKLVKGVATAHWTSNRKYTFDVETSLDGKTWTTQLTNVVSSGGGKDDDLEIHLFKTPVNAKYVRIKGMGTSVNSFTHISELAVLESK